MDVVIFEVEGQRYALQAECVSEVLDPVPVTPLPYAPEFVDGLVNVSGFVVVQMDAAMRLEVGDRLNQQSGNVLVICNEGRAESAVHVERVITHATVADEEIARQDAVDLAGDEKVAGTRYLAGSFQWCDTSVLLLAAHVFSPADIFAVGEPDGEGGLLASVTGSTSRGDSDNEAAGKRFSCLIVKCNGERYGLPLDEVGEVVDEFNLTILPHAPLEVSGMALLRGAPLLALSLGAMLGGAGQADLNQMVVVAKNGINFGLLVDEVAGIEYFADHAVQEVESGSEIEGYLIGGDGSMIGLLGLSGLITEAHFNRYREFLIKNHLEQTLRCQSDTAAAKRRMLTFRLGREQCAIALQLVERVEEYRDETGLPGSAAAGLSGVVQIQGEVVPVIDLRSEIGGEIEDKDVTFLVVRIAGGVWALTVNRVERVIEIAETDIEQIKTAKTDYIAAVGRLNGRLISILTLDPLAVEGATEMLLAA